MVTNNYESVQNRIMYRHKFFFDNRLMVLHVLEDPEIWRRRNEDVDKPASTTGPQCWACGRHPCGIAREKVDGPVAVVSNGGGTRAAGAKMALELLEALVQVS